MTVRAQTVFALRIAHGNIYRCTIGITVRADDRNLNAVALLYGCGRGLDGRGKRPGMTAHLIDYRQSDRTGGQHKHSAQAHGDHGAASQTAGRTALVQPLAYRLFHPGFKYDRFHDSV